MHRAVRLRNSNSPKADHFRLFFFFFCFRKKLPTSKPSVSSYRIWFHYYFSSYPFVSHRFSSITKRTFNGRTFVESVIALESVNLMFFIERNLFGVRHMRSHISFIPNENLSILFHPFSIERNLMLHLFSTVAAATVVICIKLLNK